MAVCPSCVIPGPVVYSPPTALRAASSASRCRPLSTVLGAVTSALAACLQSLSGAAPHFLGGSHPLPKLPGLPQQHPPQGALGLNVPSVHLFSVQTIQGSSQVPKWSHFLMSPGSHSSVLPMDWSSLSLHLANFSLSFRLSLPCSCRGEYAQHPAIRVCCSPCYPNTAGAQCACWVCE